MRQQTASRFMFRPQIAPIDMQGQQTPSRHMFFNRQLRRHMFRDQMARRRNWTTEAKNNNKQLEDVFLNNRKSNLLKNFYQPSHFMTIHTWSSNSDGPRTKTGTLLPLPVALSQSFSSTNYLSNNKTAIAELPIYSNHVFVLVQLRDLIGIKILGFDFCFEDRCIFTDNRQLEDKFLDNR